MLHHTHTKNELSCRVKRSRGEHTKLKKKKKEEAKKHARAPVFSLFLLYNTHVLFDSTRFFLFLFLLLCVDLSARTTNTKQQEESITPSLLLPLSLCTTIDEGILDDYNYTQSREIIDVLDSVNELGFSLHTHQKKPRGKLFFCFKENYTPEKHLNKKSQLRIVSIDFQSLMKRRSRYQIYDQQKYNLPLFIKQTRNIFRILFFSFNVYD